MAEAIIAQQHIHTLVLEKKRRWSDTEVAASLPRVFCQQVVGLLAAREAGKFRLCLPS